MTDIVTGNPLVVKMIVGFNRYQYSQLPVVKIGCAYKLLIEYLPHLGITLLEETCVRVCMCFCSCFSVCVCVCVCACDCIYLCVFAATVLGGGGGGYCTQAENLQFLKKCRSGSVIFDTQTVSAKVSTSCTFCSFLLVTVIT